MRWYMRYNAGTLSVQKKQVKVIKLQLFFCVGYFFGGLFFWEGGWLVNKVTKIVIEWTDK